MLAQSVVREFGGKVAFVVENYGDSALAKKYGVTRYPAIFVDDVLVAKPKDFGFYGKGEGGGEGRYTPWRDSANHEKFRTDLRRMVRLALEGQKEALKKEESPEATEIAKLPAFTLKDLSGETITEKEVAGKVVLVEFWATWCPPCRGTLQWLGKLQKDYGKDLVVLAIAIESDEADVKKLVNELGLPLRWAIGTAEAAQSFGDVSAVPTLFLFDRTGKAAKVYYGAPPDLHTQAETDISSLMKSVRSGPR